MLFAVGNNWELNVGYVGVRTVCRQANKICDICAICVRLNEDCTFRTSFFGNKCSAFNVVKSYTNLSLIFASSYLWLRRSFIWRPVLIGRPPLDIENDLADCLEVLGEEEVWGIFPEKDYWVDQRECCWCVEVCYLFGEDGGRNVNCHLIFHLIIR